MAKRSDKAVLFLCTGNYYRSRFADAAVSGATTPSTTPVPNFAPSFDIFFARP